MGLNKRGDYSNLLWFSQNLEKRFYAQDIAAGKGTPSRAQTGLLSNTQK